MLKSLLLSRKSFAVVAPYILMLVISMSATAKSPWPNPDDKLLWQQQIGQTIVLIGIAANAKLGAVILVEGEPFYIADKNAWEDALLNKKIRVRGKLTTFVPPVAEQKNGEWSAGVDSPGELFRLEEVTVEKAPD